MKLSELERLKQEYEIIGRTILSPENGREAVSCMKHFRDMAKLNLFDETLTRQYEIARQIAIHYNMDISELPARLTKNERGNIEVGGRTK